MTLAPGARLGPYDIVSFLGAGGMGEVYRARDSRLRRDVAIKILPAEYVDGPESLRRFEREARAAAALSHPNIVAVYDIGRQDGMPYIVSELLAGRTLRDILRGGAPSERQTIDYALQMADGLAAAHEKGIVHRDLKPENLFVTTDGRVKLLDFGLAKLTLRQPAFVGADNPTASSATAPGMMLGTIGYMSPEQIRGDAADQRSDLFSFGAILHEMLTDKRAFAGDTPADIITAILTKEPAAGSAADSFVSRRLDAVARHCLAKTPDQRFQSARDVGISIQIAAVDSADAAPALGSRAWTRRTARWLAAAAAALAIPLAILVTTRRPVQPAERAPLVRFTLTLPEKVRIPTPTAQVAVSPDGEHIALTAQSAEGTRIWLRSLREVSARPLAGTEGVTGTPFWSHDSRSIGFAAGRKLKKTTLNGSVQAICDVPSGGIYGSWNRNGVIIFSAGPAQPLFQVGASGGQPVQLGATSPWRVLWPSERF